MLIWMVAQSYVSLIILIRKTFTDQIVTSQVMNSSFEGDCLHSNWYMHVYNGFAFIQLLQCFKQFKVDRKLIETRII